MVLSCVLRVWIVTKRASCLWLTEGTERRWSWEIRATVGTGCWAGVLWEPRVCKQELIESYAPYRISDADELANIDDWWALLKVDGDGLHCGDEVGRCCSGDRDWWLRGLVFGRARHGGRGSGRVRVDGLV